MASHTYAALIAFQPVTEKPRVSPDPSSSSEGAGHETKHYANEENPSRCFVRLYRLYISKLAPNSPTNSFYFKPLQKISTEGVWYSKQPIGHNTLSNMMANLCQKLELKDSKQTTRYMQLLLVDYTIMA